MKQIKFLFLIVILLVVSGCASVQEPINFDQTLNKGDTIGIMYVESAKAETAYTGQIGLLDYGIISAVNSGLDKHLNSLTFDEYSELPSQLNTLLQGKGFNVKLIDKSISRKVADKFKRPSKNLNKTDFSKYKDEHGIQYLLLIDMPRLGTTRSYYGPVPTSEPLASVAINAQLIELETGKLFWYRHANPTKNIDTPWDESKQSYPNLTNAIYTNLNNALEMIKLDITNMDKMGTNKVAETAPNKL